MEFDKALLAFSAYREGLSCSLGLSNANRNPYDHGSEQRKLWDKGYDNGATFRDLVTH